MTLSNRAAYEELGYVVIPHLLADEELKALQRATDEAIINKTHPIVFDEVNADAYDAVPELYKDSDGRIFRRLNRVIDRGGAFERITCGTLVQAVAQIIEPPIHVCLNRHNMVMLKAPYNPAPVQWHQDAAVWDEGTFSHVSAIVAIDDFRPDSGCLEVVPGSHKLGPLGLGWEQNISRIEEEYRETINRDAVKVELKAGDAVIFHGLLLHGSPGNDSPYARRSLTVCFYPGDLSKLSTRQEIGNSAGHRPIVKQVVPL